MTGADDPEQVAPVWPDAVLRENVARALSHNSDADRSDYDHFRGYWLSAADAALHAAGLAEVLAERDRARDVAVALEQELAGYDARVHAALKQIIRTVSPPDAQEKVEFVLADWQDPAVPGRYTSFLEAHEYGNPAVREATEELARETVQNEWARRGLALGGLLTGWAPRPLVGRPHGWTFTAWGTPAADAEHANTLAPAYDSSGESHPFEGTDEACARCGLIRAAPYHGDPVAAAAYRAGYQHAEGIERIDALQQAARARARTEQATGLDDPAAPPEANIAAVRSSDDARRPAVEVGEWVRILERPAGLPAGQIGKAMPPGFTPPSTPASRVIAVKVGPGHPIDASAWEVIDHPGRRECPECCAELGLGEKHADDCDRAI